MADKTVALVGEYEWRFIEEEGNPQEPGEYLVLMQDPIHPRMCTMETRPFCDMADERYEPFMMVGQEPDSKFAWCESPSRKSMQVVAYMEPAVSDMANLLEFFTEGEVFY